MKTSCFIRVTGIALAGASAILLASASAVWAADRMGPLVIAHRGGAALLPENTFPAFDNAVRLGVDMLEFDMQMTADNQLIISHDGTVNPTFCIADAGFGVVPGPIRAMKLADVLKFDCGSKHRAIYPTQKAVPGTRMPTPDAFFARYKDAKVQFYGETKMPGAGEGDVDPVVFTRLVAAAVHKYGLEDRFILQSADYRTIDAMHEINPRIRTCLLYPWLAKMDYLKLAQEHHAVCMLLRLQDADASEVKQLRDAGIMVFSDVDDDPAGWRAYINRGVDALFTNAPQSLETFLKKPSAIGNDIKSKQASDVVVLAHRGCWMGRAPEVSLAAIESCEAVGADIVEVDVRKSRDGVLVLMHDDTVDRTTNGKGAVSDMLAADILRLRLKSGSGGPDTKLTDEHVPTLEQALSAVRGKLLINLHLKVAAETDVANLVKQMNMVGQVTTWVTAEAGDKSLIHSPLEDTIGIIPTINDCTLSYPAPCWPAQIHSLQDYAPTRSVAFFLDYRQTPAFIRAVANGPRPEGTRIFVETLNNEDKLSKEGRRAEWGQLIGAGVSIIMTNYPGELIEFLRISATRPADHHSAVAH